MGIAAKSNGPKFVPSLRNSCSQKPKLLKFIIVQNIFLNVTNLYLRNRRTFFRVQWLPSHSKDSYFCRIDHVETNVELEHTRFGTCSCSMTMWDVRPWKQTLFYAKIWRTNQFNSCTKLLFTRPRIHSPRPSGTHHSMWGNRADKCLIACSSKWS
jgi:hypothetical protein